MRKIPFFKTLTTIATFCLATVVLVSAQTVTTIATFKSEPSAGEFPPGAPLTQGADGNFYGASGENLVDDGSIFRITPSGKFTTLYKFCPVAKCADGSSPNGGLVLASNGNLYGTTQYGGTSADPSCSAGGCGTIFEITPSGKFTTLYNFCSLTNCADGTTPLAGLTLGANGNLFGTTTNGGPVCGLCGSVFEITPSGHLTTLSGFDLNGGYFPTSGLTLGNNGNFYGTTGLGGTRGGGTVYAISPTGAFRTLFNLQSQSGDGQFVSPMMQGEDGKLYGITLNSLFELTLDGAFSTLYTYCGLSCDPESTPTQGTDGNFYGPANVFAGTGLLYQLTPGGSYTVLYNFCTQAGCVDGARPNATLMQATDGLFYGVTGAGGDAKCQCGTFYSLSMGLSPFVKTVSNFGQAGTVIGILGNNLQGTTAVTFNGTSAKFSVVSSTLIKAQVPSGATTGIIQVTTPSGILSSNVAFQVK